MRWPISVTAAPERVLLQWKPEPAHVARTPVSARTVAAHHFEVGIKCTGIAGMDGARAVIFSSFAGFFPRTETGRGFFHAPLTARARTVRAGAATPWTARSNSRR